MSKYSKFIIIGGGLSGLTTAYMLSQKGIYDISVIESRDRLGGRVLTDDGVDLGATWFQNHHENVLSLLNMLDMERFRQYSKGKSVLYYNSIAPPHFFETDPSAPSALRIEGGSTSLIQELSESMQANVYLNTEVIEIVEEKDLLTINTTQGVFEAEHVVITIPPRIATRIKFSPELPEDLFQIMNTTHTWMSNAMKVGLKYRQPFWRNKNMSGTVIGQVGAVTELYDHTDFQEKEYALMGFVNEALRDLSSEDRKIKILDYLQKLLGSEVLEFIAYKEKDWSKDQNTSCEEIKSIYLSPSYGNPIFKSSYFNEKLLFSGAETSPVYGGYMDGAIYSGMKAAGRLAEAAKKP